MKHLNLVDYARPETIATKACNITAVCAEGDSVSVGKIVGEENHVAAVGNLGDHLRGFIE